MAGSFLSGLRVRLVLLVTLTLLPLAGLLLYRGVEQRASDRQNAETQTMQIVRAAAARYTRTNGNARQFLVTLTRLTEVRQDDLEACSALLANILAQSPLYTNIAVLDIDGTMRCGAKPLAEVPNPSQTAWFQNVLTSAAL